MLHPLLQWKVQITQWFEDRKLSILKKKKMSFVLYQFYGSHWPPFAEVGEKNLLDVSPLLYGTLRQEAKLQELLIKSSIQSASYTLPADTVWRHPGVSPPTYGSLLTPSQPLWIPFEPVKLWLQQWTLLVILPPSCQSWVLVSPSVWNYSQFVVQQWAA